MTVKRVLSFNICRSCFPICSDIAVELNTGGYGSEKPTGSFRRSATVFDLESLTFRSRELTALSDENDICSA